MMNKEFKDAVLKIKSNHADYDYIDSMVEKFGDFVDRDNKENRATNFLNKLEDIDERCLLVRLFCNYHYQVNNGGHAQYFDNGFASSEDIDHGCFGKKTDECDLHKDMIRLVKKYFPCNVTTMAFVGILEEFVNCIQEEDCYDCDGNGYCYDEENDEEEECWTCHGDGVIHDIFTTVDTDRLDAKYYEIENDILKIFDEVVYKWLISDGDGVLNEFKNDGVNNTSSKAKLKLVGTDGNAFAIMGNVITALKEQRVDRSTIEKYLKEAKSGDYNNLLAVSLKYCDEANIEVC